MRNPHRNGSGQRHVRLPAQQALACQMDGDQGGRASRLNGDAGPLQIELVGNPGAQKILVVADESGDVFLGQSTVQPGVHEIGVHGGAREHADAPLIAIRVIARIFERLVRQFQQDAVLRIHGPGFHRREAEKRCIEIARLLQYRRGLHVVRIAQVRRGHAGLQDLLIRKPGDRLHAFGEIAPELVDVRAPGKRQDIPTIAISNSLFIGVYEGLDFE